MTSSLEELGVLSKSGPQCASGIQNISDVERWISLGAGAAMLLTGLTSGRSRGVLMSLLGGALIYRGYSGHCHLYDSLGIDTAEHNPSTAVPAKQGFKFEKTVAINRPAKELYAFWANVQNLPQVMRHLKEVREQGDGCSHWVAEGIAGKEIHWDAEIINQREGEMIAWRSMPGGDVETAGSVHFRPLGAGQGTAVTVSLKYNPPGGKLGATLASILGAGVEQKVTEDLQNFKRMMESRGSSEPSSSMESASSMGRGSSNKEGGSTSFGRTGAGNGESID